MKQTSKQTIIKREFKTSSGIQVREQGNEGSEVNVVSGYAIMFNQPSAPLYQDEESEVREVIDHSAITPELLNNSDIVLTMFHDRQLILGRSKNGAGTLSYTIDEKGVKFECTMPRTNDGRKAVELISRGDIDGCSFIFTTHYYDKNFVERSVSADNGKSVIEYRVKKIEGIYDFTITNTPAYPTTSVEAREFAKSLINDSPTVSPKDTESAQRRARQIAAMRSKAKEKIL